jgi:hypothetical protein
MSRHSSVDVLERGSTGGWVASSVCRASTAQPVTLLAELSKCVIEPDTSRKQAHAELSWSYRLQAPVVGTGAFSLDVQGTPTSVFYVPCGGEGITQHSVNCSKLLTGDFK